MPVYKIADINILINPVYGYTERQLADYLASETDYAFDATATAEEIAEKVRSQDNRFPPQLCEGTVIYTKICQKVLEGFDGLFFHSSSLCLDGEGYLFTALSGTGKSTHAAFWRELFGDRVTMINDDKPLIRRIGGRFYVCGTPWMGKSNIGTNTKAPIKAIYVLCRGGENRAEAVSPAKVFKELLEATLLPGKRENTARLLELYDELFSSVKLFRLSCKPEIEAARVAYEAAQD